MNERKIIMAKMYTLDEKLLIGTPELRIGDKVYSIDDRKKTVDKVLKLYKERKDGADYESADKVLELALSPKDYKEITSMDISWRAYQKLVELVVSAMIGEEPENEERENSRFQPVVVEN